MVQMLLKFGNFVSLALEKDEIFSCQLVSVQGLHKSTSSVIDSIIISIVN
jgi:hypothetical protein